MSKHWSNTSRIGDFIISLGSLFQWLTTAAGKIFFLISILDLPWHNFKEREAVLADINEGCPGRW